MPEPEPTFCPNCPHPPHRPGAECEGIVDHGPKRWHRCLCLNRAGDRACPAQMDCQGGTLGYADVWHLVRGRGPDTDPEPADRAAVRDRIAAALYERATPGCRWVDVHPDDRVEVWDAADAVLAVLPAAADRAAEWRAAAVELDSVTWQFDVDHCTCGDCNLCAWKDAAKHLRRLADEAQQGKAPVLADRASGWRLAVAAAAEMVADGERNVDELVAELRILAGGAQKGHEFAPDVPRAPGLCATCGDSRVWHRPVAEGAQR